MERFAYIYRNTVNTVGKGIEEEGIGKIFPFYQRRRKAFLGSEGSPIFTRNLLDKSRKEKPIYLSK